MRGAVSPPKALNTKDSGSLNKYFGLKAFNPIAAEILNEGRNSLRAVSTSHFAAFSWCSACITSGRCNRSWVDKEWAVVGIGSCKKSTFVRCMVWGNLPNSRFRLFSVSTIDWRRRNSSACALANSASNFSTANCVSASASFWIWAILTASFCNEIYCCITDNL